MGHGGVLGVGKREGKKVCVGWGRGGGGGGGQTRGIMGDFG